MLRSVLATALVDAPQALCDILDASRGAVQPPIRSEIFGALRFVQHGRSLAQTHRSAARTLGTANFFPRLKGNIAVLREAHHYISVQARTGYDLSPAAEWLLDNYHLIDAQLEQIYEGLPRRYFRALPMLLDEPLAGLPRIYSIAWAFVAHTDGAFDEGLLVQFLGAYEEVRELGLREMWALPTTLRVVLVENLRRLAERVASNKAAREVGNLCFDRIEQLSLRDLDGLLEFLTQRGVEKVFLAQMAQRMQDRRAVGDGGELSQYQNWLHSALPDLASMHTQLIANQAADNLSVSNAVSSLRAIGDADWPDIISRTSTLMRHMLTSSVFAAEDTGTRDQTLHAIEALAKKAKCSEVAVANILLSFMREGLDAGEGTSVASHWLKGSGRPALMDALGIREYAFLSRKFLSQNFAFPAYMLFLATVLAGVIGLYWHATPATFRADGWLWWPLLGMVLLVVPASEAIVALINRLISESLQPQRLPRLAFLEGIPAQHRVMVVMPVMLTGEASTQELVRRLELHYLANPEVHAQFALLSDWADADTAQTATDAVYLAYAQRQIQKLNALYPRPEQDGVATARFVLLHRERKYCETQQRWIGWERKRGKLELLVSAAATGSTTAFINMGVLSHIEANTPYLLTLDSDTQLPPGRLRELVGVAAHPHNQPRLDATGRRVDTGYAILQPRVVPPLPEAKNLTFFHWLFSGQCGIDTYSASSSEVYQDLFAEGTYTGKGLLHVQALHTVLHGRLPEGLVLSHDLVEGSIARCAAVTEITLFEDAPFHSDVAASRVHRWTRGDWQLLPLMVRSLVLRTRYPMRAVNLWKMVDNLRRSLVAPASLLLLALALAGVLMSPWLALAWVCAAFTAGPLMGAVAGLVPSRYDLAKLHFYRGAALDLLRAVLGGVWHIAQLLQNSLLALNAVYLALYRMAISGRQLLQWTTAATAQAQMKMGLGPAVRRHWVQPVVACLLLIFLVAAQTPTPVLAWVLCVVWGASPVWGWLASRMRAPGSNLGLPTQDRTYLEGVARDTWRFFERCVTGADNHLPPDNLQTSPHDMVAHRTSPTNIGLYILSVTCARKFGWIGTVDLVTRLESTLATLLRMERHRGHFLNWYDTQSCTPLMPMYVSTVDSGNLSGHLLAAAQACVELAHLPFGDDAPARAMDASLKRLRPLLAQRATLTGALREELRWLLADHRALLRSAQQDQQAQLAKPTTDVASAVVEVVLRLRSLAAAFEQLAWEADFSFLYHRKRNLFHIGYRVAEQQKDAGFYDLLASESRLTSLLAIAKGDVPVRHWAALGRIFFAVGAKAGLRSWSGSMFEYLMPTLVLQEPNGSALNEACEAALWEQMHFVATQSVPWGISESAYAASDHTLAYQYAPQGVPRLALRRTPQDELVIAPYATALAAQIAPEKAVLNFVALQSMGVRRRYGFIDALDFTPARRVGTDSFTAVDTYMAHHQGMSIVALANVLLDGVAQRWGMANAHVEAVASLLHERVPREISQLYMPEIGVAPQVRQRRRVPGLLREVSPGVLAVEPTHVLSNGRYSVALRSNGAGWSRWGSTGITRQRDDALRDAYGSFFFVRGDDQQAPVSITQHPAADPLAVYQSVYHADRVCFEATWPELRAHTTVWVSPEDDIEFRQVELRNLGSQVMELELISAFEVALSDPRADEAHPAFTNLFVRAQWLATQQALVFERKPRLPTEQRVQLAHFLATTDPRIVGMQVQTDRQIWMGRNQQSHQPAARMNPLPRLNPLSVTKARPNTPLNTPLDTGLDPMCALAVRIRIAPGANIKLTFATAASDNAGTLHAIIDKYRQHSTVKRASLMSATLTGIRLRSLRINAENVAAMQTLTTALVMTLTRPQSRALHAGGTAAEVCDKKLLWRLGISGDRPIILVSIGVMQGLGLLRALTQVLNLWSWAGIACDLVVVNAEPISYLMELQREILALRERRLADMGMPGGASVANFYALRADELSAAEISTLNTLARVRLHADGRPLVHHVKEWEDMHEAAHENRLSASRTVLRVADFSTAAVAMSVGKFDTPSGDFAFEVSALSRPLRPWINVLANPAFGGQVSETGGGYTWALNSRLNQLTAWSNDPVCDPPSEWFLLQDNKTQEVWSVAPNAWTRQGTVYQVVHGQGYTTISHRYRDLAVTARWCVDAKTSVKSIQIALLNHSSKTMQLRVIGLVEWLMGSVRSDRSTVRTAVYRQGSLGQERIALLATQRERSTGFGGGTAFFGLVGPHGVDWTCDRRECFDADGRLVIPEDFDQHYGDGLDPCAALATPLVLGAGELDERTFLLGYAGDVAAAQALFVDAAAMTASQRWQEVKSQWDQLLGATMVKTPDPVFDVMVNRWLLYQTVACRLWAKSGFYQAGGATGFRDQLQDSMALAWAAPEVLRAQIILCASRQFPAGDVQHWWHAPTGAGVRTHFSDDLLWLAYACKHYVRTSGDEALLDQEVPFIEGAEIPPGAEDAYYVPWVSEHSATVYEHAARAIDRSLQVGVHGLPLMGTGDWNDGMNRVGAEGRGESVWLAWFLCQIVADFTPLAQERGDAVRLARWQTAAQGWKQALLGPAWDGAWFTRAFFDDGQPLGSKANAEARIDLIAQAWSVLSKMAPLEMQRTAMDAVEEHLVDAKAGLIKLLDPPLDAALPSAGYIQAYPAGVRENGGQYSHGGVWALMAAADLAKAQHVDAPSRDTPYRYFTYLSSAHRALHPILGSNYGIEPYVMAGDVYTQPPYVGRGGWSWYTGAAAWMHRAAMESIFGLQLRATVLAFTPCLPLHWHQAELTLVRDGRTMRFILVRAHTQAALQATAQCNAKPLQVGEPLVWKELAPHSCFVIPLLGDQ